MFKFLSAKWVKFEKFDAKRIHCRKHIAYCREFHHQDSCCLTLLITKWRVWVALVLHERTKLPGCETQSRTRKSPSDFNISSARWRGIGPWYQACDRKSLESNANSHSRAFLSAIASWAEEGVSGDSCKEIKRKTVKERSTLLWIIPSRSCEVFIPHLKLLTLREEISLTRQWAMTRLRQTESNFCLPFE